MTAFLLVAVIGVALGGGLAGLLHLRDRRRRARARSIVQSWPGLPRVQSRATAPTKHRAYTR